MTVRDVRMNSRIGRLILAAPVLALLVGKSFLALFGVDPTGWSLEIAFALMLAAIAGYGSLLWRLTMNEHDAQQDELY